MNAISGGVNGGVKLTEIELKILELLSKDGSLTVMDLTNKTGAGKRTVERYLQKLKENHFIERVGADKDGSWRVLK